MYRARWESPDRYYGINLYQDLLGDWMLLRFWGDRSSARGNSMMEVIHMGGRNTIGRAVG